MSELGHRRRPCGECPWRVDAEPGKFSGARYEELRETCRSPRGGNAELGAPLFACHMSAEGAEVACAGWLAREGVNHVGVRLAVVTGRLPAEALDVAPGWPALHEDYEALEDAQG